MSKLDQYMQGRTEGMEFALRLAKDKGINCNLRLDNKKKIFIHNSKPQSAEYMTDSSHNATLEEYKKNILQEGDRVLLIKLNKHEKYVVIAKVVVPE